MVSIAMEGLNCERKEGDRRRGSGTRKDHRYVITLPRYGRAAPRAHPAQCPGAAAEGVVWHAGYAKTKDSPVICFFRADKYMTFGLTDKANFTREEGATHQLLESAWFFTALDDATEARFAAIVRKTAS